MTEIKSILDIETLYMILPSKVGSPISIPSLTRDLKVSYNSIKNWLSIMERFFLAFSIGPYTKKISRAISKERKYYIWDSPQIKDPAARFENMIAIELWRGVSSWNEIGLGAYSLHFIKNRDQQECDFLITGSETPFLLIEAKLSDNKPSPALKKFQNDINVPAVLLIYDSDDFFLIPNGKQKILITPACQ